MRELGWHGVHGVRAPHHVTQGPEHEVEVTMVGNHAQGAQQTPEIVTVRQEKIEKYFFLGCMNFPLLQWQLQRNLGRTFFTYNLLMFFIVMISILQLKEPGQHGTVGAHALVPATRPPDNVHSSSMAMNPAQAIQSKRSPVSVSA